MDVFFHSDSNLIPAQVPCRHRSVLVKRLLPMHVCDFIQRAEDMFGTLCELHGCDLGICHESHKQNLHKTMFVLNQRIQQNALTLQTVLSQFYLSSPFMTVGFWPGSDVQINDNISKRDGQRHRATMGPGVNTHSGTMTVPSLWKSGHTRQGSD